MKNKKPKEKTIAELKKELKQLQKEKKEREEKNNLQKEINKIEREKLNNFLDKSLSLMGGLVSNISKMGVASGEDIHGTDKFTNDLFEITDDKKEERKKKKKKNLLDIEL